jgi:NADH-quinone oxidoreductase subunit E
MNIPTELAARIDEAISHYPVSKRSASLPLLHLFQEHFGFISDEAIHWIAVKLELEPINILELVTFYPMFRRRPAGRHHIRVCRTLSCAMRGGYELMEALRAQTGIVKREHGEHGEAFEVSPDGKWSIEFVECLASCGTAPVCMVNDDFYEDVNKDEIGDLLRKYD